MLLGRQINLGAPVSTNPLNRGLVSWHLGLLGRDGGYSFPDVKTGRMSALSGTVTTPWSSGEHGRKSLYFNADRHVLFDTLNITTGEYTYAFRYYFYASFGAVCVVGRTDDGTSNDRIGCFIGPSVTNEINVRLTNSATNAQLTSFAGDRGLYFWQTGIVVYRNGGQCNWFCNGARTSLTATGPSGTVIFETIGRSEASAGSRFKGLISSFMIWDRALSDSEAQEATRQTAMGFPDLLNWQSKMVPVGLAPAPPAGGVAIPRPLRQFRSASLLRR